VAAAVFAVFARYWPRPAAYSIHCRCLFSFCLNCSWFNFTGQNFDAFLVSLSSVQQGTKQKLASTKKKHKKPASLLSELVTSVSLLLVRPNLMSGPKTFLRQPDGQPSYVSALRAYLHFLLVYIPRNDSRPFFFRVDINQSLRAI